MANLREALAGTAYASLEWSPERERAVDRVAASGRCSRLGLAIWKSRYLLEVASYRSAIDMLVKHYRERYKNENPGVARTIVEQCFHEFMAPACKTCHGARELLVGETKVTCDACHGTGVRRYNDYERSRAMQMSLARVRSLSHKMRWLMGEIAGEDAAVNALMAEELERGK